MDRPLTRGKVRDLVDLGDSLVLITSDRISAFDRPLGDLPGKGELLNQLSLFWFSKTADLVENHLLEPLGPRSVRVRKARMVPVEVVVRGFLTGSALRAHQAGRAVPGLNVDPGLPAHGRFAVPQVTPTTKGEAGAHDLPIDREGILRQGYCEPKLWDQIERTALALYQRGQSLLADQGLLLVDTKYEFGVVDGRLLLCDEVHTPDCSRFWYARDYTDALREGRAPRQLDKEVLRAWLAAQGFHGEGEVPAIPDEVLRTTLSRYEECFEASTGAPFRASGRSAQAETARVLSTLAN